MISEAGIANSIFERYYSTKIQTGKIDLPLRASFGVNVVPSLDFCLYGNLVLGNSFVDLDPMGPHFGSNKLARCI